MALHNRIIYNSFSPWVFDLGKAEGSYIWKADGTRLIDFSAGWNVANLGWNNPEVAEAVVKQAQTNVYAPMWTTDKVQNEYASKLTAVLPNNLQAVGRATGGTEANEMALKMARAATGRSRIIGIKDSYHGQAYGVMSVGFRPEYVKAIAPMVPQFTQLVFPSNDRRSEDSALALDHFKGELEAELKNGDVAAVLTEAGIITGWGSVSVAPSGYLKTVRELTSQYDALLILDEVGTGFSRCGRLFALELEGVIPDIVTLAKGIANGAGAIGAVITTNEIAEATVETANLTSTFGWNPLTCAAALKTLEIHERERIWEKAAKSGDYLQAVLREKLKDNALIKEVRGKGMEVGIELTDNTPVKTIVEGAMAAGLHIAETEDPTIQLMPPLTMERSVLDEGISILLDQLCK